MRLSSSVPLLCDGMTEISTRPDMGVGSSPKATAEIYGIILWMPW